jgi:hypothetical protein
MDREDVLKQLIDLLQLSGYKRLEILSCTPGYRHGIYAGYCVDDHGQAWDITPELINEALKRHPYALAVAKEKQ